MVPAKESDEKIWAGLAHCVLMSLSEFAKHMPKGYLKWVWAWEFDSAMELDTPVDMADNSNMTIDGTFCSTGRVRGIHSCLPETQCMDALALVSAKHRTCIWIAILDSYRAEVSACG